MPKREYCLQRVTPWGREGGGGLGLVLTEILKIIKIKNIYMENEGNLERVLGLNCFWSHTTVSFLYVERGYKFAHYFRVEERPSTASVISEKGSRCLLGHACRVVFESLNHESQKIPHLPPPECESRI